MKSRGKASGRLSEDVWERPIRVAPELNFKESEGIALS